MDAIPFLDPIFREVIIACMIVISKVFPGMKNVFLKITFFFFFGNRRDREGKERVRENEDNKD